MQISWDVNDTLPYNVIFRNAEGGVPYIRLRADSSNKNAPKRFKTLRGVFLSSYYYVHYSSVKSRGL